jgi:hypothetical protein
MTKARIILENVEKLSQENAALDEALKAKKSDMKTLSAAATLPPEEVASIEITKGLIGDTAKITLNGKPLTYAQAKRLRSMVLDYTIMRVERDLAVKASIRAKKETEEVTLFWDTKKNPLYQLISYSWTCIGPKAD